MEDYKIDYVERIKSLLEKEDYTTLSKFMTKIKPKIEGDQHFNELTAEIDNKNYEMAIAVAEELIYENTNEDLEVDDYGSGDSDSEDDDYGFGGGGGSYQESGGEEDNYY